MATSQPTYEGLIALFKGKLEHLNLPVRMHNAIATELAREQLQGCDQFLIKFHTHEVLIRDKISATCVTDWLERGYLHKLPNCGYASLHATAEALQDYLKQQIDNH